MLKLSQLIYNRSPIFIQNAIVTAYGHYIKQLRYGDQYIKQCELLRQSENYSKEELLALQSKKLSELIQHAFDHVPYYRSVFKKYGLKPENLCISNFSEKLPTLAKNDIRTNGPAIWSTFFDKKELKIINTSGTTGTPLTIHTTKTAIQKNYAFFARSLSWAGVSVGDPSVTFAGRVFIPPRQNHPPYWRTNKSLNNMLFSSYHISEKNIPYYIEALELSNPRFIDSYPSAIHVIARYIIDKKISHSIKPKAIITSSETLLTEHKHTIEQAFGCRVYDQYGSAEMTAFFAQCEHGSYHVNPEYGIVEILDDSGRPVKPGHAGRLVCTGFLNLAMPFIRYYIGDSAIFSPEGCKCGRNFPVVESLLGRTDDLIVTKDGRSIGRLDPIFKGLVAIKETQIIQKDIGNIVVKIVRDEGYSEKSAGTLIHELKKRIGDDTNISIEYVERIPRTSSGKFRSVISYVSSVYPKSPN